MLQANPTSFDALYHDFRWNIPTRFNIAEACVTRYANATPDAPALIIDHGANEAADILSWGDLEVRVQKIAAVLVSHGVSRGDRVAIQLPQGWEAVATHLATYRLGALATPFATQFGPQAIAYRINKARPKVFVATPDAVARWQRSDTAHTSTPETLVVSDNAEQSSFHRAFDAALPSDIAVETTPNDPAMLLFTSGTTGQPKGVVHGHRVLLGHLPGIQLAQEMMPQLGDVFWTPSDWAWAGGLLNALLPALYFGVPVVAANAPRFSAEWALDVMARNKVTNVFVPPTAIRIIANHQGVVPQLSVRAVGAAGEQLGAQT
ncbi:MAG: AMP-binding protein, partial [Pseudomonadota bacterium]